jgi:hypothetical protein
MFNWFLCWWHGHDWMPGYRIFQRPLTHPEGVPPDTPVVVKMTRELVDYKCLRCGKVISRDDYDQWERSV